MLLGKKAMWLLVRLKISKPLRLPMSAVGRTIKQGLSFQWYFFLVNYWYSIQLCFKNTQQNHVLYVVLFQYYSTAEVYTVEVYQVILRVCCFSHPAPPALTDHRYCPVEIIIPEYLKRCVLSSHKRIQINLASLLAACVRHITERPRNEAIVHKEHKPCLKHR